MIKIEKIQSKRKRFKRAVKSAFFICNIMVCVSVHAQDVITLKNGTDINALVQEISDVDVKYKKFETPNGPDYTLKKSEILLIRYANGSKDIFSEEPKSVNTQEVSMPALKDRDKYMVLENYRLMVMRADLDGKKYQNSAAKSCEELNVGGFSDWRLPTKSEIEILYQKKESVGGFVPEMYWSVYYNKRYWSLDFGKGTFDDFVKGTNNYRCRCVRSVTEDMQKYLSSNEDNYSSSISTTSGMNNKTSLDQSSNETASNRDTKDKKSKGKHGYKKNAFELDLSLNTPPKPWYPGFEIGIGWLHNATRYFAWDIIRIEASNLFSNFDIKNTGLALWMGPKVYFVPITEKIVPFIAFRFGVGTSVLFENIAYSISPELGVNLTRFFYLSFGYAHSWSKKTSTYEAQESYIKGYNRIYMYSTGKYESVPIYGTRTVTKSETTKSSGGVLFLRFGFNF